MKRVKRGKYDHVRVQSAARTLHGIVTPAKFAEFLSEGTSTAHKWWSGKSPKISAVDVIFIADKLGVNPRWIMGLTDDMRGARTLDHEEGALLDLYEGLRKLPDSRWCNDWLADGHKLLEKLGEPSPGNPFGKK